MKTIRHVLLAAALGLPGLAGAKGYCGKLNFHYGPYDYRTDKHKLDIVDQAHFTEEVEAGIKGASDELGGDLHYTLSAFPNHHRALATVSRVALRDRTVQLPKSKYPVECYFLRAIQFAPTDAVVRSLYGSYLYSLKKYDRALEQYKEAIGLDPDNAMVNYNIGLAYMKNKDYERARQHARKAYDLGYPLQGLKNQLVSVGKWDPKPAQ